MSIDQKEIEQVVKAVLAGMGAMPSVAQPPQSNGSGVFVSLDDAVRAAMQAQQALHSVATRQLAIAAIRQAGEQHAQLLAVMAVEETGMGRVADKYAKNVAQARERLAWSVCSHRC